MLGAQNSTKNFAFSLCSNLNFLRILANMDKNNFDLIIITQYFYPDIAATGLVLTELAEDLVKYNKKVRVLAGQPSYYSQKTRALSREEYKGVQIKRFSYLRLSKDNLITRLIAQFSFFIIVLFYLLFSKIKFRNLLIVSNPPSLPFVGYLLKKFKKFNFIYLVHDIYPDIAIKLGVLSEKSLFAKLMDWINRKSLTVADFVVVLGQDAKEIIFKKGLEFDKIKVITNWADADRIKWRKFIPKEKNKFLKKYNLENKFIVLYTGNLGLTHNLMVIVDVAEKLKEYPEIQFIFVGSGGVKRKLENLVQKKNLKNVFFLPYQEEEIYSDVLSAGDLLLVTLAKGLTGFSVPSKTYIYLANGGPIAAMIDDKSETGRLIDQSQCGFRVEPGDADGFAKKVLEFYQNPELCDRCSQNARKVFGEKFERSIVTKKYLELLK